MSEWISVKDRLPPDGLAVLAYGSLDGSEKIVSEAKFMSRHNSFASLREETEISNVTHWMLKPLPPKD